MYATEKTNTFCPDYYVPGKISEIENVVEFGRRRKHFAFCQLPESASHWYHGLNQMSHLLVESFKTRKKAEIALVLLLSTFFC